MDIVDLKGILRNQKRFSGFFRNPKTAKKTDIFFFFSCQLSGKGKDKSDRSQTPDSEGRGFREFWLLFMLWCSPCWASLILLMCLVESEKVAECLTVLQATTRKNQEDCHSTTWKTSVAGNSGKLLFSRLLLLDLFEQCRTTSFQSTRISFRSITEEWKIVESQMVAYCLLPGWYVQITSHPGPLAEAEEKKKVFIWFSIILVCYIWERT